MHSSSIHQSYLRFVIYGSSKNRSSLQPKAPKRENYCQVLFWTEWSSQFFAYILLMFHLFHFKGVKFLPVICSVNFFSICTYSNQRYTYTHTLAYLYSYTIKGAPTYTDHTCIHVYAHTLTDINSQTNIYKIKHIWLQKI